MTNYYPVYRDIKDWAILDTQIVHDYSEDEKPIEAVEILIGTLHYHYIDFMQHHTEKRTPIIRWLTRKQYENLVEQSGQIIW